MLNKNWISHLEAKAVKSYKNLVSAIGTNDLDAIAQKNHRETNTFVKCIVSNGVVSWEVNGKMITKADLLEFCE